MAGIGFELKKLFDRRSAIGYFRAYTYTMFITASPFILLTGMVLVIQLLFSLFDVSHFTKQLYIASVVYPFIFSHIISSGFAMLITRYVADQLYSKNYSEIIPSLYGTIAVALGIGSIPAIAFFWNAPLAFELKVVTYIFYMELIVIWIQGVYLTALKDYKKIIHSYAGGAILAVLLAFAVLKTGVLPPLFGAMLAMNIGVLLIAAMLMINIKKFFAESSYKNFLFLRYFESHFNLFWISLFYAVSLYIPNIIIWNGPLAVRLADTYVYAPIYDIATFYAFLSILPVMVIFVVSTELHFYQKYSTYFMYITEKGNFKEIEDARRDLLHVMWSEIRNIVEFQLAFTFVALALGNYLLPRIGLTYASINMYNLIVLGAYSTGILQVIITILLYIEDRKGALWISAFFLLANASFNLIGLGFGENTYGFGFFLAAFLSLVISLGRLVYYSNRIDYFVFCSRPVFYNRKPGFLAKTVNWLYGEAKI
jgi:uncharacterized membrane protein